jgi:hypothetical protein
MAAKKTGAHRGAARRIVTLASALGMSLALGNTAEAYDEPNLNLGFTSFLDGGVPAGPGFYAVEYLQFYTANKLTDQRGNNLGAELGLPKTDIDALVSLSQLIYVSNLKIGPASPGLDVIVPWVASANVSDGVGNTVLRGTTGVGDLLIGPLLQFDPIMGANGPLFVYRVEAQIIAPTGEYDWLSAVQPGANFWSFDPYFAGTYFLTPDWTVSARIHYLWNGKNDAPNASLQQYMLPGESLVSSQAGQAFHVNFATEYAVTKELRIGLNGYYLQQTTDTEVNDIAIFGRKERVAALGPGFMYSWGPERTLFFNAYQEFAAENRPEGERFTLRYVQHF